MHVDLLAQFAFKNYVLDIKLRGKLVANVNYNKKGVKSGHVGHMMRFLVAVITMSHKMSIAMLNKTIRASLNHVDPLTNDRTNRNKTSTTLQSTFLMQSLGAPDLILFSSLSLDFCMTNAVFLR